MNDNTEMMVPSRTTVWLAPVGTAVPADCTIAPAAGWKNVGYTPEDSLSFSTEPAFQEVRSAQSDYPTLRFQTSDSATVSVDLQQWNPDNFKAVYGGGTVTEVTPATTPKTYKFVPPKIGARTEVACLIDVEYGAKKYRYVVPRAFQNEGVQKQLHKGAESRLPLRLAVLGSDAGDPFYILTNDESWAVAP